jgi:colanic acid biosynthesis protein WcaH
MINLLNNIISQLNSHIDDPRKGLPEEVFEFVSSITPLVNVDLLVHDKRGRVLLSWRDDEYCGTGWHVPGGIVRFQETREERLQKTALREFGCEVENPSLVTVNEIILPQTVRGHHVAFGFKCSLPLDYEIPEGFKWSSSLSKDEAIGKLHWHSSSPEQWVKGQREIYELILFPTQK